MGEKKVLTKYRKLYKNVEYREFKAHLLMVLSKRQYDILLATSRELTRFHEIRGFQSTEALRFYLWTKNIGC